MNNLNSLADHQQAIMDKHGEGLPYERERIVHEARFYMEQSADAMLEACNLLIILKENEPHGEFMKLVTEQLVTRVQNLSSNYASNDEIYFCCTRAKTVNVRNFRWGQIL